MKKLEDYVTVDQRIAEFYKSFPDGSLRTYREPQLFHVGEKTFIAYAAAAYRDSDDELPGIGWAWEPVPGPTSFTRDSELQNAETSAWGRAIAALGFSTHDGIASREEVQARQKPERTQRTRAERPVEETNLLAEIKTRYARLEELEVEIGVTPPTDWIAWSRAQLRVGPDVWLDASQMRELIEMLDREQSKLVAELAQYVAGERDE